MTLTEKVAYLKGLAAGLELDIEFDDCDCGCDCCDCDEE